jgi:hypothetical protein
VLQYEDLPVEQLDALLIQKNNEREAAAASSKAEILHIQEIRDRKRAGVSAKKKFDAMSPQEQEALVAQTIQAKGLASKGKVGTP